MAPSKVRIAEVAFSGSFVVVGWLFAFLTSFVAPFALVDSAGAGSALGVFSLASSKVS